MGLKRTEEFRQDAVRIALASGQTPMQQARTSRPCRHQMLFTGPSSI